MTKKIRIIGKILIAVIIMVNTAVPAKAMLVFTNDVFQNQASIFRIGQDYDAATNDIQLQFGTTNTKTFMWDQANARFDLSDTTAATDILTKAQGDLRLGDADTSNYVGLQAPTTVTGNLVWTLPAADGSNGQLLGTNGTGTLGWSSNTLQNAYNGGTTITTASSTPINFTLTSGGFTVGGAGATTIGNNTGTVAVDSTTWDITTAGVASGLTGITSANGAISLNSNSAANTTAIGTGTTTGAVSIGGGSNAVSVDSTSWDISTAGLATGLTGITSTGNITFTGATSFRPPQAASAPGSCNVGQIYYNTTTNDLWNCTTTNTWTKVGLGSVDFENVYLTDADDTLTTSNGAFTIAAGSGAVAVNSTNAAGITLNGSVNGPVNIGTGTSTGTVTLGGAGTQTIAVGNGGGVKTVNLGSNNTTSTTTILSGSGGVNINASNNQPTNINTGTSTGAMTFGNSLAGALSMTSGAAFTLAGGAASTISTTAGDVKIQPAGTGTIANVQIGEGGAGSTTPDFLNLDVDSTTGDPAGGVEGSMYYNTSDNKFRCFENATWTDCVRNPTVSAVTDTTITSPTPGTYPTYGTEIEILTPTRPSITPDNTSQQVLINGAVHYSNPTGGDDTNAAIRVRVRRGSGNCAGTQVGPDLTAFISDPIQSVWVPFTLVDSPATASAQAYTVCAALADGNGATATNATTPIVMITVQEIGP